MGKTTTGFSEPALSSSSSPLSRASPWEGTLGLEQGEHSIPFSPAAFRERLILRPDGRASSWTGSTHEATRGVSDRCRLPCQALTHLVQLCEGFRTNPQECPFSSGWLLVTSSEFGEVIYCISCYICL